MIKLTWEQIQTKPFQTAVVAVNNCRELDAKQVYRAGRICHSANKESEKIAKLKQALGQKHGFDQIKGDFPTTEAAEACKLEVDKLEAEGFVEIKVMPLDWNAIFGKVKLSGLELVHLEAVCENVPESEAV